MAKRKLKIKKNQKKSNKNTPLDKIKNSTQYGTMYILRQKTKTNIKKIKISHK
jgi:hypothetical protein